MTLLRTMLVGFGLLVGTAAHPRNQVDVTYGSSGSLHTQIQQGAPFDIFFSADISLPRELANSGLAESEVRPCWLIPDNLHDPLEQGYIITRRARNNPLARDFSSYVGSPAARAVMTRYGFVLPGAPDVQ